MLAATPMAGVALRSETACAPAAPRPRPVLRRLQRQRHRKGSRTSSSFPGVWGGTATGILNPHSKSECLKRLSTRLSYAPRWQQVCIQLGEMDCGHLIWNRAERHGLSVDQQLCLTLDSYTMFIQRVIEEGRWVLVLSAPLPAINDSPHKLGPAKLRAQAASMRQRTELTLRFNAQLRERCDGVGAVFIEVTSGQLDPATGLIHPRFLRNNADDNHLARGPYSELISRELSRTWDLQPAGQQPGRSTS
jgi:hypothetical protein